MSEPSQPTAATATTATGGSPLRSTSLTTLPAVSRDGGDGDSSKPRRVLSLKPKSRPVAKSKLELEVMAAKAAQMYAKSTAGAIEEIDLASSAPPSYADLRPASTSPVVPRAHAPRKRSSTVSGPDSGADACLPPPHSIAAAAAPPSALAEAGSSAPATRATTTLSEFRNSSNSSSMPSFAGRERSASVASIAEHSSHTALTIPVPARGSGSSIMKMMSRRSSEVSTGAIAYTRSAPSVSSPLAYAKPQPENVAERIMINLLNFVQADEIGTSDIFFQFVRFSAKSPTVLSAEQREILQAIQLDVQRTLASQTPHVAATTIQKHVRRWLVQRRMLAALHNSAAERARSIAFNRTFATIVERERKYFEQLDHAVQRVLLPLRAANAANKSLASDEELGYIFWNAEDLRNAHRKHLAHMSNLLPCWPRVTGVGELYINFSPVLKLYDEYVLNYKNAQDVLKLVKSRGKLNPYLAELAQKHPSMGELSNILAQPLTYIAKTHALLEQLIANCEPGSTDMVLLERAHSVFVERAASLQQSLAGSVSIVAILGVQRRLTGADGIELLKPDRTLVSEGTVLQNGSKRHLFFFNDLLLVTRPSSKGNQCRFKEAISITSLELLDDPSDIKAFVVKSPHNTYNFVTKSKEERDSWMSQVLKELAKLTKHQVFGVALSKLIGRERRPDGVPEFLFKSIEFLQHSDGPRTHGLFRISGEKTEMLRVKDMVNNAPPEEWDLSNEVVHTVSGALKLWLRELPDPLMTFHLYKPFLDVQRARSQGTLVGAEYSAKLKHVVDELPGEHRTCLKHLVAFLKQVAAHSDENQMTAANLAIVFGPTLLRPRVDTIETSLETPMVIQLVEALIEHSNTYLP